MAITSEITVIFLPGEIGTLTSGILTPKMVVSFLLDPQAFVVGGLRPERQADFDFDALLQTDRPDAEQFLDIDNPDPANLHMVTEQFGTGADDDIRRRPGDLDHIVGDQPMSALDQIERDLGLADAGFAGVKQADAVNVDQGTVRIDRRSKGVIEIGGQSGGEHRGGQAAGKDCGIVCCSARWRNSSGGVIPLAMIIIGIS